MVAYVSLMRNGLTESQLAEARQELKNMYAQDGNVFTGLILYWREVRGKSHGEDLLCGDKNVQERLFTPQPNRFCVNYKGAFISAF